MSDSEIRGDLYATVYGQNVVSEETLREWCRMFKDWRKDIPDEERSVRPSVV
jgi:hypothetical protein